MEIESWIYQAREIFDKFPNDRYWIFCASNRLYIMKREKDGSRKVKGFGKGFDSDAAVAIISGPEIDGGDW